jgi:hypothetical protein
MAQKPVPPDHRGIYNVEYFSGAQAAMYIGDVWVDEVTSISYGRSQSRTPLYGYADTYFRDVSEGQVIVQGQFTINFKETGYLFLILDRYREKILGKKSILQPFLSGDTVQRANIERMKNNELTKDERIEVYKNLAELAAKQGSGSDPKKFDRLIGGTVGTAQASLSGFSSDERLRGTFKNTAESVFEAFEDGVWQKTQNELDSQTRNADDPRLNPFDIYVVFGDYAGDNSANHTVQKLSDVHILGTSKQVIIDGQPIQEAYSFIARNLV